MKKYLMTGVAALAICAAFTSCSKSGDELYDQGAVDKQKELSVNEQYAAAFEKAFGKVGPDVDWGFSSASAGTRGVIKENHELPNGLTKPTLKDGEAAFVMDYFQKTSGENSVGIDINKFFIVYVGGNNNVKIFSSWNESVSNGQVVLDYLQIDGEHINDWNANNGPTVYVYDRKADNFTSHNSYCDLTTSKWKLAKINYQGEEGWYVGLSAYGRKNETTEKYQLTDYDRENFYDDWVFKIVPAETIPTPASYRVIAEDLSATDASDFDFNDVVFDVIEYKNGQTTLRLQAAGGTLPLKVAGQEVHALYGESAPDEKTGKYSMFNTGHKSHAAVDFTIDGDYCTTREKIKNIPILVQKDGQWMELSANTGKPACKILVDTSFKINGERNNIANSNKNFTKYVTGEFKDEFWWD